MIDLRARLGPELRPLASSYFSVLTLPFAFYYLLCFIDDQGAGITALGRTFDPWDIVMYATGVGLAAAFDVLVLSRLVRAWPLVP